VETHINRPYRKGTLIMNINKKRVTHHIIPLWWRQWESLKHWTFVQNWCSWSPKKIFHSVETLQLIWHKWKKWN